MVEDKVQCKWCGQATPMVGTKECDFCYELRSRVDKRPDLARVMLAETPRGVLRKLLWIVNYAIEEGFGEKHLNALVRMVGLINTCEEAEQEILEFADALFRRCTE